MLCCKIVVVLGLFGLKFYYHLHTTNIFYVFLTTMSNQFLSAPATMVHDFVYILFSCEWKLSMNVQHVKDIFDVKYR